MIIISKDNKRIAFKLTKKDFEMTWFSGSGAGGQYRNKHQNCLRLKHIESGVIVTGQSQRDRVSNQKEAFNNLKRNPKFRFWCEIKLKEVEMGQTLEEWVEEQLKEENLVTEIKVDGVWKEVELKDLDNSK